jgi:hypothetical protein
MRSTKNASDNPARHFVLPFIIAIAIYIVAYGFIEHRRNRKGPWLVSFRSGNSAIPEIIINQPFLAITNVCIRFEGEAPVTQTETTFVFDKPRQVPYEVPFGQCIFMDTTFLPGTETFRLFNHEIELLPRTMIIDHDEHPWAVNSTITLPRVTAKKPSKTSRPEKSSDH